MRLNGYQIVSEGLTIAEILVGAAAMGLTVAAYLQYLKRKKRKKDIDENIGYLPEPKQGQSTVIRPIAKTAGTLHGALAGGLVGGPLGALGGAIAGNKVAGAIGSSVSRGIHSVKPIAQNVLSTPDKITNAIIPHAVEHEPAGVM